MGSIFVAKMSHDLVEVETAFNEHQYLTSSGVEVIRYPKNPDGGTHRLYAASCQEPVDSISLLFLLCVLNPFESHTCTTRASTSEGSFFDVSKM